MKCAPFQLRSTRNPMREFCGLKRNSESLDVAALLNGMLPKLLPKDPPAFLSFQDAVRSMKPTGMMVVSPILSCSGDDASAAAACGAGGLKPRAGAGAGGAEGNIGVVEATSPRFAILCWGWASETWSSIFICASKAACNCSICFFCASNCAFSFAISAALSALFTCGPAGSAAIPGPANAMDIRDNAKAAVLNLVISILPEQELRDCRVAVRRRCSRRQTDVNREPRLEVIGAVLLYDDCEI